MLNQQIAQLVLSFDSSLPRRRARLWSIHLYLSGSWVFCEAVMLPLFCSFYEGASIMLLFRFLCEDHAGCFRSTWLVGKSPCRLVNNKQSLSAQLLGQHPSALHGAS